MVRPKDEKLREWLFQEPFYQTNHPPKTHGYFVASQKAQRQEVKKKI